MKSNVGNSLPRRKKAWQLTSPASRWEVRPEGVVRGPGRIICNLCKAAHSTLNEEAKQTEQTLSRHGEKTWTNLCLYYQQNNDGIIKRLSSHKLDQPRTENKGHFSAGGKKDFLCQPCGVVQLFFLDSCIQNK